MAKFQKVLFPWCVVCLLAQNTFAQSATSEDKRSPAAPFQFFPDPSIHFSFNGFVGERIQAMVDNWLLPTPHANPGMLEMFRLRDRDPKPNLVPWAGEFVGKYLISGIQTLRMTENPELKRTVTEVVHELISTQADDGYLGPFPKAERLRGNWDLWGHYHCMLGLLMWHEATGEKAALDCARKAADLVCATYLDSGRRVIDAGSDEMNLAISHSLGWLYRITKEPRYLRMMNEIEKDWERGGDYLQKGLEGVEFYQSPRPRWESLHDLQALVEFYQIQRDARYRQAFEHHWRSIARFDTRNTGGFSSGEQATGNPYAPTAIETCCTIAWMCLSVDMLKLTGDPRVADRLELATLNAWAGAQHPSGRWCTYSTPMDGARQASAHEIVFQARPGTAELNCCSVNGPRGWGMLSEWATMRADDGLVQNWLGPSTAEARLASGNKVKLHITGNYPVESEVTLTIEPEKTEEFTIHLRVPQWSKATAALLNGKELPMPAAGSFLKVRRSWKKGDKLLVKLDFGLRAVPGDKEARGKVSVYRGPILLAWDQRFGPDHEEKTLPILNLDKLKTAALPRDQKQSTRTSIAPLLLISVQDGNTNLFLCDFASAGATGTRYKSWLPATNANALQAMTQSPRDGAIVARGTVLFRYKKARAGMDGQSQLQFSEYEDDFSKPVRTIAAANEGILVAIDEQFKADKWYYWRVVETNRSANTPESVLAARFRVDPRMPVSNAKLPDAQPIGPNGELILASLHGSPVAKVGTWNESAEWRPIEWEDGGKCVQVNGINQKVVYTIGEWPADDYSVSIWFRIEQLPRNRLGQVISGWSRGSDDPLRLVVDNGKLFARIEAGSAYSTQGVPITTNQWHHAVALKEGSRLALYLDGTERSSATVPEQIQSTSKHLALGGNPLFVGNEHLAVSLSDFAFYGRALKLEEVQGLHGKAGLR
jgi:DUF1680 family protein